MDSNEKKITKDEIVKLESGEDISVNPEFLLNSIEDTNTMFAAHVAILKAVGDIIQRGIKDGMDAAKAGKVALELQRRAAKKANSVVHMNDKGETSVDKEEEKKETDSADSNDETAE